MPRSPAATPGTTATITTTGATEAPPQLAHASDTGRRYRVGMSGRILIALLAAVLAIALAVDYAFHLDSPKPNRPAIVQLQRQVAQLQRRVAILQHRVDTLERRAAKAAS